MFMTLIEIFQDLLEEELIRRILVAFLLPNLLVLGFTLNHIDNDKHKLWRSIVGPYWSLEKSIFFLIVGAFALSIIIPVSKFILIEIILPISKWAFGRYEHYQNSKLVVDHSGWQYSMPSLPPLSPEEQAMRQKEREAYQARKYHEHIAALKSETEEMFRQEEAKRLAKEAEFKRRQDPKVIVEEAKARALRDITGGWH